MSAATAILAIPAMLAALVALVNTMSWGRVRRRPDPLETEQSVAILIPARNEAAALPGCLSSAQRAGGCVTQILVYDDDSTDGTAEVVRQVGTHDPRIRLVDRFPLPAGWLGKPHACQRLADASEAEWLLFLDADARLAPEAAVNLVAAAQRADAALLSAWPKLALRSTAERVLMPLLNHVVLTLFPTWLAPWRRTDASLGLAHGACLLVRRDAYERVGGHAAVRDQLFEDTGLARAFRSSGAHSLCLDGQDVVGVRMYDRLSAIWSGFQKNTFPAFKRSAVFWAFFVWRLLLVAPYVALGVALSSAPPSGWLMGAVVGVGASLAGRVACAVRFRHPLWSVVLHPIAELFLMALMLESWRRCTFGGGVGWKGRLYLHTHGAARLSERLCESDAHAVAPLSEHEVRAQ